MTVGQLRLQLAQMDDDAQVTVVIGQHNKAYSIAQVTPFMIDKGYSGCAVYVSLPSNMHTVTRKA